MGAELEDLKSQLNQDKKLNSTGTVTPSFFRAGYIRFFKNYLPVWLLFLAFAELTALFLLVYLVISFARLQGAVNPVVWAYELISPTSFVFSGTLWFTMISMGLYQRRLREGSAGIALRIIVSHILAAAALAGIYTLFPEISIGYDIMLGALIFSSSAMLCSRIIFLKFVGTDIFKRRVLVLGAGEKAASILNLRRWIDRIGYTVVGFLDIDCDSCGCAHPQIISQEMLLPLKSPSQLPVFVDAERIDEIVIAVDDRRRCMPMHDLLDCKMQGVQIIDLVTFYEREIYKLKLDMMDPSWLIFCDGFQKGFVRRMTKRLFDIFVSASILLCALPVMLITAIIIKLESKGPVFYTQERVGENGNTFTVMKFRSMCQNAEKGGEAIWATKNDARVTRVGAFIRLTRIDELPQLINVLRGDMSFVGPRPERPQFVEQFNQSIPYYNERHRVKPGITGWAQICYPYGASERDAFEKLQYDLYYVKNYSLFLDFMIMLQTAEVIIWQKGAR